MYNNRRKGEDMFKLKKEKSPFNLNEKEEQVMKVLWKNDMPMSATEIANEIESDWAKKSIQNIIRKLESKNAIEIAEITKIGKTYGRLFRPTYHQMSMLWNNLIGFMIRMITHLFFYQL